MKLGCFHRDLLAPDSRVGEEERAGFLQFATANSHLGGLSHHGPLGKNCLQVGLGQLGMRKEGRAEGEGQPLEQSRYLLSWLRGGHNGSSLCVSG